ncbi:MAG: hypothetical protein NT099_00445 [Candidatus Saganbacteria bacterium]|nr:hypothetical protein [Candidatus Saganbacteria bacterium]
MSGDAAASLGGSLKSKPLQLTPDYGSKEAPAKPKDEVAKAAVPDSSKTCGLNCSTLL